MENLTETQWLRYQEQGYLKLGKLLDQDVLNNLQQQIDDIMMGKAGVDYDRMMMQLDSEDGEYGSAGPQTKGHKGPTLNYRKIQNLEWVPAFLEYIQWPLWQDLCERVYGTGTAIACMRAMFMNKPSNRGTFLPWHQDRWTNLDRDPLVTVWTALDPATIENGCVKVIPKSHHALINADHASGFLTEAMASDIPEDQEVFLELEAGEVVLLHNWLLHSSDINRSSQSRRAFSTCYMDAATVDKSEGVYPVIFGEGAMNIASIATGSAIDP